MSADPVPILSYAAQPPRIPIIEGRRFTFPPPPLWRRLVRPSIGLAFCSFALLLAVVGILDGINFHRSRMLHNSVIATVCVVAFSAWRVFRLRRTIRHASVPVVLEVDDDTLTIHDVAQWGPLPRVIALAKIADCYVPPRIGRGTTSTIAVHTTSLFATATVRVSGPPVDIDRAVERLREAIEDAAHIALPTAE